MTNELFGTLFSSRDNQYDEVMQRMNGLRDELTKIGQQQTQIDNKLTEQIDELKDELTTLHEDHKRETEKLWDQLLVQKAQYESLVSSLRVPTAEEKRDKLVVEITEMLDSYNGKTIIGHDHPQHRKTFSEYYLKWFSNYTTKIAPSCITYYNSDNYHNDINNYRIVIGGFYDQECFSFDCHCAKMFVDMPSYKFDIIHILKKYEQMCPLHLIAQNLECHIGNKFTSYDRKNTIIMITERFIKGLPKYVMPTLPNETEAEYEVRVLEHIKSYIEEPCKKYIVLKNLNLL